MKEFSVIILCYNSEKEALRKTIDSVLIQKNIDCELLLADDCSQNGCLQYAKDYLAGKDYTDYKVIEHNVNVGTVQNIFDAVQRAEGRFTKCIGAGDLLLEDVTLRRVYDYMSEESCVMCFGKMQAYRMNQGQIEKASYFWPPDIVGFIKGRGERVKRNVIRYHGWIPGASMFYDTERFKMRLEEITGIVKYCEDLLQVLLFVHGDKVVCFPYGAVYYEMGSGISTNNNNGNLSRIQNDHINFWKDVLYRYPEEKLIKKGYHMYQCELIPQVNKKRIRIILAHPGYILMIIRTKLQHRWYIVRETGLLM